MKRPLLVIGLSFFLSAAAALLFGNHFAFAVGLFLLIGASLSLLVLRAPMSGIVASILFTASIGMGMVLAQELLLVGPVQTLAGKTFYLEGRVAEITDGEAYTLYLLDATIPQKEGSPLRTKVRAYQSHSSQYGELEGELGGTLSGYFYAYPDAEGERNYSLLSKGILLSGYFKSNLPSGNPVARPPQETEHTVGYWVTELRATLVEQCQKLFPPNESAVINAMLFGDKSALSEDVYLAFQRSGLVHLTAVSGFHLSLISALILSLFSGMGFSRRTSSLLALPFIVLFMAVAGFTPSVLRSGLMMGTCILAMLVGERYDGLNALGLSMLLILFLRPYSALDVGFLLSFAATAGILVLSPRIIGFLRGKAGGWMRFRAVRASVSLLGVSLAAQIFTIPVSLLFFDSFSLIAPLSSLLVMSLASLMLWCAALLLPLSMAAFSLARLLAVVPVLLCRLSLMLTRLMASLPLATLTVRQETVKLMLVIFYTAALALFVLKTSRKIRVLCLGTLAVFLAGGLMVDAAVRQNTLELITYEGTETTLMVRGTSASLLGFPETEQEKEQVAESLKERGIRGLDAAVSLKGDTNEALGTVLLFQEFPVKRVYLPQRGVYTDPLLRYTPNAQHIDSAQPDIVSTLGAALRLIPCDEGYACLVSAGKTSLLKCDENCAIIGNSFGAEGELRGFQFNRLLEDGRISLSYDEEAVSCRIPMKDG